MQSKQVYKYSLSFLKEILGHIPPLYLQKKKKKKELLRLKPAAHPV